uniref:DUF4780 domain-containing protein n=1 Tax=Cuerna arida TaxID=1464854 RepID=A0A1B6GFV1_9HEMI
METDKDTLKQHNEAQGRCGQETDDIPLERLSMDTPPSMMEEEDLLRSGGEDNSMPPGEQEEPERETKKRLSRGELRRKRREEALARGERVLSRKERRRVWEEKHGVRGKPSSETGPSGALAAKKDPVQSVPSKAQPSTSHQKGSGVKRTRLHLTPEETDKTTKKQKVGKIPGSMEKASGSYAEKLAVEKLAIVHVEHPGTKLQEETAMKIRMELGRRALRGQDVRMTSCHFEGGAVVVGCANAITKEWLEKQFSELNPLGEIHLKLGPAHLLVKMVKVTSFIPRTTGAETKEDAMLGLKSQNGLKTENWSVVGGNSTPEGQFLVFNIDEESLQILKTLGMRPFVGCERVLFKVQGGLDRPKK